MSPYDEESYIDVFVEACTSEASLRLSYGTKARWWGVSPAIRDILIGARVPHVDVDLLRKSELSEI
jgi:hypothetical protein